MAQDESQTSVESDSLSEPDDCAVKTATAVSSNADPPGILPIDAAAARAWIPVPEDPKCAGPDEAVKTEIGTSFPSKWAAAAGELTKVDTAAAAEQVTSIAASLKSRHIYRCP